MSRVSATDDVAVECERCQEALLDGMAGQRLQEDHDPMVSSVVRGIGHGSPRAAKADGKLTGSVPGYPRSNSDACVLGASSQLVLLAGERT